MVRSAWRVTLLSQYIFRVTGPGSGDWELSHAGYLLQLGGKDRSVLLSDDELLRHEEAIANEVLAILAMMLEDILLISPWTSLDEYRGNVYREQGVLARHELAWPFTEPKLDLEELLGALRSLLEAGLEERGALLSAAREADKDAVWVSRLSHSDWRRDVRGVQTQP